MLVLSSTVPSRYYNCWADGSVSPGNYEYYLASIKKKCYCILWYIWIPGRDLENEYVNGFPLRLETANQSYEFREQI
jgi:hypothetical protein